MAESQRPHMFHNRRASTDVAAPGARKLIRFHPNFRTHELQMFRNTYRMTGRTDDVQNTHKPQIIMQG